MKKMLMIYSILLLLVSQKRVLVCNNLFDYTDCKRSIFLLVG